MPLDKTVVSGKIRALGTARVFLHEQAEVAELADALRAQGAVILAVMWSKSHLRHQDEPPGIIPGALCCVPGMS